MKQITLTKAVNILLQPNEIQLIVSALNECPYKLVADTIESIFSQLGNLQNADSGSQSSSQAA